MDINNSKKMMVIILLFLLQTITRQQICHLDCSSCDQNPECCLQCQEGFLLNNCNCNPCVTGCKVCQPSPAGSTQPSRLLTTSTSTQCTSCFEGYFQQGDACIKCSQNCQNCRDDSYCISCIPNYNLILNTCILICNSNEYFENNLCKMCEVEKIMY